MHSGSINFHNKCLSILQHKKLPKEGVATEIVNERVDDGKLQ